MRERRQSRSSYTVRLERERFSYSWSRRRPPLLIHPPLAADGRTPRLLLAGGLAGCVSKTVTAPLARLTILYQVSTLPPAQPESTAGPARRPRVALLCLSLHHPAG